MNHHIILDIWRLILDQSEFQTNLNITSTNHYLYDNLYINPNRINNKYLVTDDIIRQHKYSHVDQLNANDFYQITYVSMLHRLRILCANYTVDDMYNTMSNYITNSIMNNIKMENLVVWN